jgi:type IV pilus assembly protein PilW
MFHTSPAPNRRGPLRQTGLTLIELMVGILIGLLAVGAAIAVLVASRGASGSVSDISALQQQASHAMRVMGIQFRQAGSLALDHAIHEGRFGVNDQFANLGGTGAPVAGTDAPDTVSVATQPEALLESQRRDCVGNPVAANGPLESTFELVDGALRCRSRYLKVEVVPGDPTEVTQPIIRDVADFQVTYRVEIGGQMRIMTAKEIADRAVAPAPAPWADVKAIEICLDMQGVDRTPDASENYVDCAGTSKPLNGRLHLVYRNVFNLRSKVL